MNIKLNKHYVQLLNETVDYMSKTLAFDIILVLKEIDDNTLNIPEAVFDMLITELYKITESVDSKYLDLLSCLINKDKRKINA